MILLERGSLKAREIFRPETHQLMLGEKDSSATLTVGPDAPEIGIGDWMQDDTDPGRGVVWRVRSISTDYRTQTRTVTLEHIIQCLKDTVMPGETTAAAMGGGSSVSVEKAARYVLGKQKVWELGTCAYSAEYPYEFNGDTVFDALETICSALEDSRWTYDMTEYPFKINIRKRATVVSCELRAGRNLTTLSRSVDMSRMYTRLYPVGANNLKLSGSGYVQKNTALYGVISKVETDQSQDTEERLRIWAQDRLRRHCEPSVTVTVNGLELSRATGENLDRLEIGRLCRIPVPELDTVMEERITRLQWKDKQKDPEDVTVTLANNREDVASIFKNESSSAEKSGRSGAKLSGGNKQDLEDKVENAAEGLMTVITRTAAEITQEAKNTKEDLESKIRQTAEQISMTVKKGEIISEINQTAEKIKIKASKIELDGETIVKALKGVSLNVLSVASTIIRGTVATIGNSSSVAGDLKVYGQPVDWKSAAVVTSDNLTTSRAFAYSPNSTATNLAFVAGRIATGTTTIYYLGR